MLFLSNRTRNTTVSRAGLDNRSCIHKVGHSCVIGGCLSIITGLILIVVGVISEVKKTTFIGVGIISLGIAGLLTSMIFLYAKLDICYNNWAYRSRVIPSNFETPQPVPTGVVQISPFIVAPVVTQKPQTMVPLDKPTPIRVVSDVEIHKTTTMSSMKTESKTNHSDNVP